MPLRREPAQYVRCRLCGWIQGVFDAESSDVPDRADACIKCGRIKAGFTVGDPSSVPLGCIIPVLMLKPGVNALMVP